MTKRKPDAKRTGRPPENPADPKARSSVSVELGRDLKARLLAACDRRRTTVPDAVREAVTAWVEGEGRGSTETKEGNEPR